MHPELSGKRLELLKTAVPKLSRLAVLWNGANSYKAADMKEVQTAQQAGKVYRVALLCPNRCEGASYEAFRRGLRDSGWAE